MSEYPRAGRTSTAEWRDKALCKRFIAFQPEHLQAAAAELWWPEGQGGNTAVRAAKAKTVCAHCPTQAECWAECMATEDQGGVWAGTSAAERRRAHAYGWRAGEWSTWHLRLHDAPPPMRGTTRPVESRWAKHGGPREFLAAEFVGSAGDDVPGFRAPKHLFPAEVQLRMEQERRAELLREHAPEVRHVG